MSEADSSQSPQFLTPRWSVVLAACCGNSADSAAALEILCRSYRYPLYAYVRRAGHGPHHAQDLTKEFFSQLLAKEWLNAADREPCRELFRESIAQTIAESEVIDEEICHFAKVLAGAA